MPPAVATVQRLGAVVLRTADLARALPFYRDALGLSLLTTFESFAFFDAGGVRLILNEQTSIPRNSTDPLLTECVFEVADIFSARDALQSRGVVFAREPRVVTSDATHETWAVDFRDPDGHVLSLLSRAPKAR
ncbi:MAG: VOC family protein [Phycisphaerae bacterium]